jgi:hypothetical protein
VQIPLTMIPYARRVRALFQDRSIDAVAFKTEILCPVEIEETPPAIFLPGQLDRITGTPVETTIEAELATATATTSSHDATIAYHIRDAVLFDGSIYAGAFRRRISDKSLFALERPEPEYFENAALASSMLGTQYFGHWLIDDCLCYILAEQFGDPLGVRKPPSPLGHETKYQGYFDQAWTLRDRARIDHLVIFRDYAQNSLKRKRYRMLRERIGALFPRNETQNDLIYLQRGDTGVRRVVKNEDDVVNALTKRGFKLLNVATDSLEKILSTLANAKVVVSVEGSHLAHATFAGPENGGVITMQPPERFETVHRDWSQAVGRRFGFVVGMAGEGGPSYSPDEILQTTDLMLKSL